MKEVRNAIKTGRKPSAEAQEFCDNREAAERANPFKSVQDAAHLVIRDMDAGMMTADEAREFIDEMVKISLETLHWRGLIDGLETEK